MSNTAFRCIGIVCLGLVAVALLTVFAVRVAASPSAVLDACINPGNGMMRLVDASTACHDNESRVEWNVEGPQGPAGPQGPQGPQGPAGSSAGGPPFVWVCTPAFFPGLGSLGGGTPRTDLYVFNGSSMTANVAIHILDKDGNNLAGVTIPGSSPVIPYPGQTGAGTVTVSPSQTLITTWTLPTDAPSGGPNVSATVTVTSDQPIAVGSNFSLGAAVPCSLLPK
jgi:hypothetical protein